MKMESHDILLKIRFEDAVVLRSFLISTVLSFWHMAEMELLSGRSDSEVLSVSSHISSFLDGKKSELCITLSSDQKDVIIETIIHGYEGLYIYPHYAKFIDYKNTELPGVIERLRANPGFQ